MLVIHKDKIVFFFFHSDLSSSGIFKSLKFKITLEKK